MALDKKKRGTDFGGKKSTGDMEQPILTAARECEEECGIAPSISYSDGVYLANSKYHLFFASTDSIPAPRNEVETIMKFPNLDAINIPLNPRLWGNKWINHARRWLIDNRVSRPALRTVWE